MGMVSDDQHDVVYPIQGPYPHPAAKAKFRDSATEVSVSHLEAEHCLRRIGGNHLVALTEYGKELMMPAAP
jgi:hypothetical protein